jgi:Tfp pilus assembly protein PilO
MNMNVNRLWTIGMVAVIVVVALAGWMLGVSPVLAQASSASDQAASLAASNLSTQAQITALKQQFAQIATAQGKLAGLRQSIPTDADMSAFLQEIDRLGSQDHVSLQTVAVQNAVVYQSPTPTGASAGTSTSTGTSTPTPTPTPTPTATAPVAPAPTSVGSSLITIPIKLTFNGSFSNVMAFVKGLQNGSRLLFVAQVTTAVAQGQGASGIQASITGDIFAQAGVSGPLPASVIAQATPTATPTPSITPTAPPSSTSTPTPTGTPTP